VLLGYAVSRHNLPLLLAIRLYSALPRRQRAWWEEAAAGLGLEKVHMLTEE